MATKKGKEKVIISTINENDILQDKGIQMEVEEENENSDINEEVNSTKQKDNKEVSEKVSIQGGNGNSKKFDLQKSDTDEGKEVSGKRKRQKPKWQKDYKMDFENDENDALYALLTTQYDDVPKDYKDIEEREDRKLWMKAVEEEFKVLEESKTWEYVPLPQDKKLIDTKWVFTKKDIGENKMCKARLVVKGFQQKEKFEDVYSPVLRMQTLRTLLAIATQRDYDIYQMDVKGAF